MSSSMGIDWNKAAERFRNGDTRLERKIEELEAQLKDAEKKYFDELADMNQEVSSLKERLAIAHEVIGFYANSLRWGEKYDNDLGRVVFMELSDDTEKFEDDDYYTGGKRARDYMNKWNTPTN